MQWYIAEDFTGPNNNTVSFHERSNLAVSTSAEKDSFFQNFATSL